MDLRYLVIILGLLGLVLAFGLLFWRKQKLPQAAAPDSWRRLLTKRVRYFRELPPDQQEQFLKRVQGFLADISIVGAETEVNLLDKLFVAASAQIPLFGFNQWRYPNLDTVILHGRSFSIDFDPEAHPNVLGLVGNRELSRTMVLSKPALHQGFSRHTEQNVGIHEFTHLLDMSDGATDGSPEYYLGDGLVGPWMRLVEAEMLKIVSGESLLDEYGATNEAEFFAVATEYFFNRPEDLESDHPELYRALERIFRQDTTEKSPVTAYAATKQA